MGKPYWPGIISKRCRLRQERRPSGNNIGEGDSGFGWIESHIMQQPFDWEVWNKKRFDRQPSPRIALPASARARRCQTHLMNRPKKDKCCQGVAPESKYLFADTARPWLHERPPLIQMCMHLDTAAEKRNRPLPHYHMRVVGAWESEEMRHNAHPTLLFLTSRFVCCAHWRAFPSTPQHWLLCHLVLY